MNDRFSGRIDDRMNSGGVLGRPAPFRPAMATGVRARERSTVDTTNGPFFTRSVLWMTLLLAAICFEGLGRVLLPQIPSALLYVAKDVVLWSSVALMPFQRDSLRLARSLYGKSAIFLVAAMVWTIGEIFNPEQVSATLAVLGLRSYWAWWCAPIIIASALRTSEERNRAIVVFSVFAIFIAFYASVQFASPRDAAINSYALYEGEVVMPTAWVHDTGKPRVAGTFSFLSGFGDFSIIAPVILLSLGIDLKGRRRILAIGAAALMAANGAMGGSRSALIFIVVGLITILLASGFIRSRNGRWATLGLLLAGGFAFYRSADAIQGVLSRFEISDTPERMQNELSVLPPIALTTLPYPLFGIGTGMAQSARIPLGIQTPYALEDEPPRLLVELGPFGYLLFWVARFGLILALLRAAKILKRGGRMGAAGGATALAVLTMFNRLVFDHVWQSLFFTAVGLILSVTLETTRAQNAAGPGRAAAARVPGR